MAPITSTNGFILAGGQSLRMGQDKATLPWGDKSLLEHMIQLLSTVAASVRVVGRGEFLDRIPDKGPLGGILTGLDATDRDSNLFVAVDLPLLTPHFLQEFHTRFVSSKEPLFACRVAGEIPLCLGIRKELAREVEHRVLMDKLSIRSFVQEAKGVLLEETELRTLGFDTAMFANMNTPQDWKKLTERP